MPRHLHLRLRVDRQYIRQGLPDPTGNLLRATLAAELVLQRPPGEMQPRHSKAREPVGKQGVQVETKAVPGQVCDCAPVEGDRVLGQVRLELGV